jgi:GlcNAc-P-P-Und epimerase
MHDSTKILLTGATGFLGKIMLEQWVSKHHVITLGRDHTNIVQCDLKNHVPSLGRMDMVVHAAGKAHVLPKNSLEADDFFKVNVTGLINLLAALEPPNFLRKFVFISSVAVYGLTEGNLISENFPLQAEDPYGKSKIAAEKIVSDWCIENKIKYYILRLPLIAGRNAPGNLGAMVRAVKKGRYFSIGEASAKKSMVLAEDIARFIIDIEGPSGIYNLTDNYHPSFKELETKISCFYGQKPVHSIPISIAKIFGSVGDLIGTQFFPLNSEKVKKITSNLTFDDSNARSYLNWNSHSVLKYWEIE